MSSGDEGDGNDFLDDDFAAAEPEEVKPASKRALKKAKRLNAKVRVYQQHLPPPHLHHIFLLSGRDRRKAQIIYLQCLLDVRTGTLAITCVRVVNV